MKRIVLIVMAVLFIAVLMYGGRDYATGGRLVHNAVMEDVSIVRKNSAGTLWSVRAGKMIFSDRDDNIILSDVILNTAGSRASIISPTADYSMDSGGITLRGATAIEIKGLRLVTDGISIDPKAGTVIAENRLTITGSGINITADSLKGLHGDLIELKGNVRADFF